jgi:hypothetical protein
MSFQHCANAKCLSTHFESRPKGHHPELPWLVSYECGTCLTTRFTCNGMCNARRTQNCSSRGLYKNMQQVRRHSKSHTASKNSPHTLVAIDMENDVPGSMNDYLMEHEEVDKLSVDDRGNNGIVADRSSIETGIHSLWHHLGNRLQEGHQVVAKENLNKKRRDKIIDMT